VVDLARRLLPAAEAAEGRGLDEAAALLEHLAAGRGIAAGAQGGLFTWGIAGNHTDVDVFAAALRPLWQELLRVRLPPEDREWDGPSSTESILLLYEAEDEGSASALTIRSADPYRPTRQPRLIVTKSGRLPFSLFSLQDSVGV
jgi:hypothetical protein